MRHRGAHRGACARAQHAQAAPAAPRCSAIQCCVGLFQVLLRPGDLLLMSGAARYAYTHGIAARTEDVWGGEVRPRQHRVSITLRRMRDDIQCLTEEAAGSGGEGDNTGDEGSSS